MFFLPKKLKTYQKNEFGESPNSLQTQKNMRAQLFPRKICVQPLQKSQKTTCARHAIFFIEFGESLEILQTHFFCLFSFFGEKKLDDGWPESNKGDVTAAVNMMITR